MKIALDAMGGDYAPQAPIEGAFLALSDLPDDTEIVLLGSEQELNPYLEKYQQTDRIRVVHAEETIGMNEHPTKALTQKPKSSIAMGLHLHKQGEVDAFCSAGNTGAMHVGAMFTLKSDEGVIRPAIASFAPRVDGSYGIILDIGANADCKADVLSQFGELGSLYSQYVFGISEPRVALINLGEEEEKGTLLTQSAYRLLKLNPRINFIGNIEGRDIFSTKSDVMVCDGFTGNIILKMAESFYDMLKERNYSDEFFDKLNYEAIGGSPVLGVNGNVVIGHGVSSALAIKNMVIHARKMAESNIHVKIREAFKES